MDLHRARARSDRPGESVSRTVVVRNSGTAPFTFNLTVASTTDGLLSGTDGLQVQVYDNSTAATNTGSKANGNRAGTCSGSATLTRWVSTTPSGNLYATPPTLTTTQTRNLCVRAWLSTTAPNALQSNPATKSTQLVFAVSATQALP